MLKVCRPKADSSARMVQHMLQPWQLCAGTAFAVKTDLQFFNAWPIHFSGPPHLWRVLDAAHQKRNLAEYEGYMDVSEGTIGELCALVPNMLAATRLLASES